MGHAAIQLAKWAGAVVITTVSGPAKAALVTAAGADHVINYRDTDAAAEIRRIAPNGVDQIVEVAPAQNAELDLAVIRNRGSVAVYANNGGDQLSLDVRRHFSLNIRYQFVLLYTVGMAAVHAAAEDINAAVADGALPVGEAAGLPLHRFNLAATAAAHAAVEESIVGKVLIDVAAAASRLTAVQRLSRHAGRCRRPALRTEYSPPGRARATLEWTDDLSGDPTAVEVPFLERHLLTVDLAGVHVSRVEGHSGTERLETRRGFRVGPPGTGNGDSAGNNVEVVRFSLELAETGPPTGTSTPAGKESSGKS